MNCENCRKGLTERIFLGYCSQEKYTEMYFKSNIYYDYSFISGIGCQTWLSFQNSYVLLFLKTMFWLSSSEALGLVCSSVPGPLLCRQLSVLMPRLSVEDPEALAPPTTGD